MTSEPDSTPRRRPPTIDLTATEVEAEKPAAAPQPGPPRRPQTDARSDAGQQESRSRRRAAIVHRNGGCRHRRRRWARSRSSRSAPGFGSLVSCRARARCRQRRMRQPPNSAAIAEILARLNKIEGAIATQRQQPRPATARPGAGLPFGRRGSRNKIARRFTRRPDPPRRRRCRGGANALAKPRAPRPRPMRPRAPRRRRWRAAISMRWRPASRRSKAP